MTIPDIKVKFLCFNITITGKRIKEIIVGLVEGQRTRFVKVVTGLLMEKANVSEALAGLIAEEAFDVIVSGVRDD